MAQMSFKFNNGDNNLKFDSSPMIDEDIFGGSEVKNSEMFSSTINIGAETLPQKEISRKIK